MELFEEGDKDMKETKRNQEEEAKKAEEMQKGKPINNKEENRKKSRASGANTMAYLKERAEMKATLRSEE